MGFYYVSIFSLIPLGIAYGALLLVFRGVARLTRDMKGQKALLILVGTAFFVLPVGEELWIAWNFGQVCKGAGTFIYKKVQVEGFYDSTMRSAFENTKPGGYIYVEQPTEDRKGTERVERVNDEERLKTVAWYVGRNGGKAPPNGQSVIHQISDKDRIVVLANGIDALRVTALDGPTARYHYKFTHSHAPVLHKLVKHEAVVVDSSDGDVMGRYTRFSRDSPWFHASLGKGDFSCDAPGRWPFTKGNFLIFRDVLEPIVSKTSPGSG